MKKRILIFSELDENILEKFVKDFSIAIKGEAKGDLSILTEDQMIEEINSFKPEILIIETEKITKRVVDSSPTIKMIVVTRGDPVNVDLEACKRRGIIVCCTPGRNANSVAELTIALMFCLSRNLFQAYDAIKNGIVAIDKKEKVLNKGDDVIWTDPSLIEVPYLKFKGFDIECKTLGVIGFGMIGKKTIAKALALGMKVLVYDPYVLRDEIQEIGATPASKEYLLANSDFVSLHCRVTEETKNLIGEKELLKMKKSAYLINTARGALVDHEALYKALKEKVIAGAAVDVFYYEPIARDDPFLGLDNFIILPHIGGASSDVITRHSKMAWESIDSYINGKEIPFRVV
ncbi:MAG TPA: NAD(P)-dependent oxidoreductase [Defluviitoga sp.]|nr:NAD(P)-dependent oxidoreductase [Defluviitoga sp.]HPZ74604.1 NAD(P)-dependent oxidoreductase [Candidatus Pacearchaeota archaeon]